MSDAKVTDRFKRNKLRERLGIGDVITVLQQNTLRRYGRVSRKDEINCVKKKHRLQSGGCKT